MLYMLLDVSFGVRELHDGRAGGARRWTDDDGQQVNDLPRAAGMECARL